MGSLHAIVVTLAIPVLAAGIAADFLYLLAANQKIWRWASRLLFLGGGLVALAAFTGTQFYNAVPSEIHEFAGGHRNSGFILLWSLIGIIGMRFLFIEFHLFKSLYRWVYYALLLVLGVLLFRTAMLGNRVGEKNEYLLPPKEQQLEKRDLFN
ncbi:MAG: hypothetical protein ACRBF0_04930 [Calditrichia bacterium]